MPLMLLDVNSNKDYWINPKPSSTRFIRPFRILFQKETDELYKDEENDIDHQIQNLQNYDIAGCTIIPKCHVTMIDGKVMNILLADAICTTKI